MNKPPTYRTKPLGEYLEVYVRIPGDWERKIGISRNQTIANSVIADHKQQARFYASPRTLAKHLGVSTSTMRKRFKSGECPGAFLDDEGHWAIHLEDAWKYVEQLRTKPPAKIAPDVLAMAKRRWPGDYEEL